MRTNTKIALGLASVAVAGCSSVACREAPSRSGWVTDTAAPRWSGEDREVVGHGRPVAGSVALDDRSRAQGPRLKGGEVDDNDRFDEYLRYCAAKADRVEGEVETIDVAERVVLHVTDAHGRPASGARLIFRDLAGRPVARRTCYADGRALFFPRVDGANEDEWVVEARLGDARARTVIDRRTGAATLRLDDEAEGARPGLDVVFCIDATGSMGDEIDALKRTVDDVVRRLGNLPGRPRVRLGLVRYRDRGDEYVAQAEPLTESLATFRSYLGRTYAAGGGDTPEDVQAGLAAAVDRAAWDESPSTARLVFLIGDAGPHLYEDGKSYAATLRRAAERGVKCFSLAASGLDDPGEYVFRQVAQTTLGKFIFVSYATPDGGRGTPHHVGPYLENDLDAIVVRCCAREVEALVRRDASARQD